MMQTLYDSSVELTPQCRIDELVLGQLKRMGIRPALVCSDAVFGRRVFLDVIGTLPTAQETREFLEDRDPHKRSKLIDRLLERDEFADYWAMKWCDLLRVKSEFPINLWPNAVQAYHRWIRTAVRDNKPYDRFARDLLTASGSNFRVPPANFYRAVETRNPQGIARAAALTFMGSRIEKWPKARQEGLAGFFSQVGYKSTGEWKEEIVYPDFSKPQPKGLLFPDGTPAKAGPDQDARVTFADWLVTPRNPWFTRNIANRVWSWLLGRGIIHEPDDIRPDNPARNPELLSYLERALIAYNYDLKRLYRLVLNSGTYQLSCVPRTGQKDAAAYFAYYPLRRLGAEVLIDALNQITGTREAYSSAIPEPFTFIPEDRRSISLADGSISSSFLELFGRPSRDTGLEMERNNLSNAAQRLHLLNSSHVRRKIDLGPNLAPLFRYTVKPAQAAETLYLTILSRYPTDEEIKASADYASRRGATVREASIDTAWALINSTEFLYRH